jgi:transposase
VQQVVELPPLSLHVTEYQVHGRICPCCGRCSWGRLPPGVPIRGEGPRLQAFLALLTGRFRLSRRQAPELLRDLFGWAPALGTVSRLEAATSQALAPVVAALTPAVTAAPSLYVDETGWRQGKERPTLWAVVTETAVLFRLGRRDRDTFTGLLTPAPGQVVVSDRYAVYDCLALAHRQLCWAHLARNFQALLERPGGAVVARWAKDEIRRLFQAWHRFQRGEWAREQLQEALVPIQAAFRALLRLGAEGPCAKTATLCRQLLERWEALWTFAARDGAEPTNNRAERALRPAVLWRKSSFGHKSEGGQQFVERILTVAGTLRLQGQPVLAFLEAACRAALTGEAAPPILTA